MIARESSRFNSPHLQDKHLTWDWLHQSVIISTSKLTRCTSKTRRLYTRCLQVSEEAKLLHRSTNWVTCRCLCQIHTDHWQPLSRQQQTSMAKILHRSRCSTRAIRLYTTQTQRQASTSHPPFPKWCRSGARIQWQNRKDLFFHSNHVSLLKSTGRWIL